jgi:hypothetical protein
MLMKIQSLPDWFEKEGEQMQVIQEKWAEIKQQPVYLSH